MTMKNLWATHDFWTQKRTARQRSLRPKETVLARQLFQQPAKAGDVNLRRALCQAATVIMHRGRATWLRTWAAKIARRRGPKRAMVVLARRIAVILHRIWKDDTEIRFDVPVLHAE